MWVSCDIIYSIKRKRGNQNERIQVKYIKR